MSKLKKIVLFSGIGVILLTVIIITSVSFLQYWAYRSQFEDKQQQAQITAEYTI